MVKKEEGLGKKLTDSEVRTFVLKNIKHNCRQALNGDNGLIAIQNMIKQWAAVLHNNYYETEGIKEVITLLDKEIIKLNAYQMDLK